MSIMGEGAKYDNMMIVRGGGSKYDDMMIVKGGGVCQYMTVDDNRGGGGGRGTKK